ncbi:efflux RND transporter periplasmic adaptor subunit [Pelomonas sp. SE-A7]|uniref:efflux RND transporter periplasmic adaptor subunit n=1 Tax=Pelomonas sp. SE-A7 TaxID=3054953 RepID=UPI00259C93AA|nr:efflux RND transporter periplasmic adaptor subunit [Pelomonas sp. SE-A7]MDM4767120.1 efflux RND transporter periplasmic adaptor subunit [Pelomonas sp. SE-A7]
MQSNNKRRLRRIAIAAGVLAIGGVSLWAWGKSHPAAPPPPPYRTAAIDQGPITQVVSANGNLQAIGLVTVGAAVNGTVVERRADFNDRVKKGQVLLRLDATPYEARLRQARAQLASAEARVAFAQGSHERNEKLLAQGFMGPAQRDQSKRELDMAVADVAAARGQVEAAETDVARCVIVSPVDGVVIKRSVDVGQTVAASFQTPELFQIARDLGRMEVGVNVSEADVGMIREGQAVRFVVDAFAEREFEGQVRQVRLGSTNQSGIVTYAVIVDVDNHESLLKPGMTAQARIVVATKPQVLRVPTAALRFRPDEDALAAAKPASGASAAKPVAPPVSNDDGVLSQLRGGSRVHKVWTLDDKGKPVANEVTVGLSNTRFTELVSGKLKAGDAVVTRSKNAGKDDSK